MAVKWRRGGGPKVELHGEVEPAMVFAGRCAWERVVRAGARDEDVGIR